MDKSNKFSPEVRKCAVRMVQEHRPDYPSHWAVIESIALKIGCAPQTLHEWVRKNQVETGEREVKELCRANEILKLASAFFAQVELKRQLKS